MMAPPLSDTQLRRLADTLHLGAEKASQSMATWLSVPSLIELDSFEQLPVCDAPYVLGGEDQTLCFCLMEMVGSLAGQIVLAFDDSCGLSLADLLLGRPVGTATDWGEVEKSAALETMNIVGSAYLNSLSLQFAEPSGGTFELMPMPPIFRRDFVESLLESVFLEQAMVSEFVVVARAKFQIQGELLNWNMLFVPDAPSMIRLSELLEKNE